VHLDFIKRYNITIMKDNEDVNDRSEMGVWRNVSAGRRVRAVALTPALSHRERGNKVTY
jgi:predicted secreted protein